MLCYYHIASVFIKSLIFSYSLPKHFGYTTIDFLTSKEEAVMRDHAGWISEREVGYRVDFKPRECEIKRRKKMNLLCMDDRFLLFLNVKSNIYVLCRELSLKDYRAPGKDCVCC